MEPQGQPQGDGGAANGAAPDGGNTPQTSNTPAEPVSGGKTPENAGFTIPEAYQKEKWASDLKSQDDVWNKLAGAEKLLGRKGVILPGENASESEINSFYEQLGRPSDPNGYEFKTIEPLQDLERNSEVDAKVKEIFFKNGVPKETAEKIALEYENLMYEHQKPLLEKHTASEKEFNELTKSVFGDDVEAAKGTFKDVMRETLKDYPNIGAKLDGLPSDQLTALMAFSKKVHDTYNGENKVKPDLSGRHQNQNETIQQTFHRLSEEKLKVRQDQNLTDVVKRQKLSELNKQMMDVGRKAYDEGLNLFS